MLIDCDGHILEPADLWERYLTGTTLGATVRLAEKPS